VPCRAFCEQLLPVILRHIRELTPRSLSNLVFCLGVLRIDMNHSSIEVIGLALCSQLPFTNGKQLGSLCIGMPKVPRWTPYRRRSIARAIMRHCVVLMANKSICTQDVRPTACPSCSHWFILTMFTQPGTLDTLRQGDAVSAVSVVSAVTRYPSCA
jgi:hypothetical protein